MDAASAMIPLTPELGGKDPLIALPGTDLPFFVPTFLRAAFGAGGQNCIGIERFLVARSILPRFIELVEPRVRALQLGSFLDDTPFSGSREKASAHVDVGALITGARIPRLEQLVADAVSKGARCLVGGKRFVHPKHPSGHYFAPTLLVDVTP
jgi:acyl-CoA reductase-like NAD-dependent aldehyde dehydrogenase